MATAGDIVTRALKTLKVYAAGETPSADDMADGLAVLNNMLFSWKIEGIDLNHVTAVQADTLDVPDEHIQTITLCLADRLSGEYGEQLSVSDQMAASEGKAMLRALYFNMPVLDVAMFRRRSDENVADLF